MYQATKRVQLCNLIIYMNNEQLSQIHELITSSLRLESQENQQQQLKEKE